MPTVTMPQLGESVAEGTIGKWLKKVGEHVGKDEPIVEVITDKVNAEVPSPFEGTLTQILVAEGQTVPNEAAIAVIEEAGAAMEPGVMEPAGIVEPAGAVETVATRVVPGRSPESAGNGVTPSIAHPPSQAVTDTSATATLPAGPALTTTAGRLTPAVRRLSREHGVDLSQVTGTGFGGRITREDVMAWVTEHGSRPDGGTQAATTSTAPGASIATTSTAPSAPATSAAPSMAGDTLKELSPMRRAIAAQMTRSLSVPVAYLTVEVDMTAVVRRREAVKREYEAREGQSLSYVAFVTKACVEALRRHQDINAHWTEEGHWLRRDVNVGIAVAVEDGLMVPVVRNADSLSLHGLNAAINSVAERARARKLRMEDVTGGTFTVDNTGWTGSTLTLPILNVPEVAIVTMERIVKRPVVVEGPAGDAIAVRSMMNMVIGFDHRATDGAQAGRFLSDVKTWLESVDAQTPIW